MAKKQRRPPLDLIEHLRETRPTRAIFTSFALSPTLFDGHVVRRLMDTGCEEILLLTDQTGYDALVSERSALSQAGCSYWVSPVDRFPRAFHPKVALLWSTEAAHLYVMSANLTHGGLWRNAEVVDYISWTRAAGGNAEQIRRASDWFGQLPAELGLHPEIEAALSRMLGDLNVMLPVGTGTGAPGIRFVHNLQDPILSQVIEAAPPDVKEVLMVAPFFSASLEPIAKVVAAFPQAKVTIAQQETEGTINPNAQKRLQSRVRVATCSLIANDRPWHAKFILIKGRQGELLLTGSPNMTTSALLKSAVDGNTEAAMLRTGPRGFSDDILSELSLKSIPWSALKHCPIDSADDSGRSSLSIRWAAIHGMRLTVLVAGIQGGDKDAVRELTLVLKGRITAVEYAAESTGSSSIQIVARLPGSVEAQLGTSAFVALQARPRPGTPYEVVRALVMCPDEIKAPLEFRRFRAALRSLQGMESQAHDVIEVLSFLRHSLSALAMPESAAPGATRGRPPTIGAGGDGLAVTRGGGRELGGLHDLVWSSGERGLLAELPGLFRRMLQGSQQPDGDASDTGRYPQDRDPDRNDAEDPDSDGEDTDRGPRSLDWASLASEVRGFLDWTRDSFNVEPVRGTVSREWFVRTQLLEIAVVLARFYFLPTSGAEIEPAARVEYVNRLNGLLRPALSAEGRAWGKAAGWFLRARQFDSEDTPVLAAQIVAQALFNVFELVEASETQSQLRASAQTLLEGLDHACGRASEDDAAVVSCLEGIVAAYQFPVSGVHAIVASILALRQVETPEKRAIQKFRVLLELQEASRSVLEIRARSSSDHAVLSAAVARRASAIAEAERQFPSEAKDYLARASRGKWLHLVPVRMRGGDACPKCNMALPKNVVGRLAVIDSVTVCPSCQAMILPLPLDAIQEQS